MKIFKGICKRWKEIVEAERREEESRRELNAKVLASSPKCFEQFRICHTPEHLIDAGQKALCRARNERLSA